MIVHMRYAGERLNINKLSACEYEVWFAQMKTISSTRPTTKSTTEVIKLPILDIKFLIVSSIDKHLDIIYYLIRKGKII